MELPILLTGGTGTLGRELLPRLLGAGRTVRVLSRTAGAGWAGGSTGVEPVIGDLSTGEGLDAAVAGIETVIHAAGSAKGDAAKAARLVDALQRAGTARHLLYISVVGADTTPFEGRIDRATLGYFEEKRQGELAVSGAGIPWTILRATQFHDFIAAFADMGMKLPVMPSFAVFRYQPVDVRDVAERLVELALGKPAGMVPAIGGPGVFPMEELLKGYLRAVGRRRLVLPVHIPGKAAKAQRNGANLACDRAVGVRTWAGFLAEKRAGAREPGSAGARGRTGTA